MRNPPPNDAERMAHIVERILEIEQFVSGLTRATFSTHIMAVRASVGNLEIIGEATGKLSQALKDQYPAIHWTRLKSYRNFLAHEYYAVRYEITWDVIQHELLPLKSTFQAILASLT
jgi:uncharacterized protein with HEPN domain